LGRTANLAEPPSCEARTRQTNPRPPPTSQNPHHSVDASSGAAADPATSRASLKPDSRTGSQQHASQSG